MGFLKKLFKNRLFVSRTPKEEAYEEEDWEDTSVRRRDVDVHNTLQRERYVKNCLEQIAEASDEIDKLTGEYNLVTEYLTDMEEIEALPLEERNDLEACASKLVSLEGEKDHYLTRDSEMSDELFEQMSRMEDVAEEGIGKLREAEDYRVLVKKDLNRLEGEKHAYLFRKNELKNVLINTRGMAAICVTALVVCLIMLVILQFLLNMETRMGYILTTAAAAVAITVIYMKYSDAQLELKRVDNTINKLILLQNRVKIRYINNRNLLDYLCLKYGVGSAEELESKWNRYLDEKEERATFNQVKDDFVFYERELMRVLHRYQIKHPELWKHQAEAILDSREMVEIRHALITRRQSLRKQLEYNKTLGENASNEIKDLAHDYPQYAPGIMAKVGEYEKK
ncbi:MAG: hypothetical protein PHP50_00975 [Lachnospiraceae bacterium]|nr:hypothetical protein [Lachnospiraceae bacterium]